MKNWKRIIYRAVAVLSAVAVFTVQVPDLRMRAYAVDPFTAMAGEEVVSYVISAIAAACGVNISSDSSDVAADVRFWVSQAKDDYEIRARVADKEVVKTVAAVSFVRAQEYFQSLADKTFTLVDNGLAVPRDVMDAVSAYFNAKTKAYTPDFVQELPYSSYRGVYSSPCTIETRGAQEGSNLSWRNVYTFPSGLLFIRSGNYICFYNTTAERISTGGTMYQYRDGVLKATYPLSYRFSAKQISTVNIDNLDACTSLADIADMGCTDTSLAGLERYLKLHLDQIYGSVVDNGVWTEAVPSDNWEWEVLDGGLSGTGEDAEVIKLYPTPETPDPNKLQEHLADALVTLEVGKLLEDLGFRKKGGSVVPTPTTAPGESESPSVNPSESPSVNPSESPAPDPSVNPDPDPSQNPSLDPSVSPSESPGVVPSIDPSLDPSLNPSPDPDLDPDFSLAKAIQMIEGFFKGISDKLDQIIDPFTQENMEKRTLKEVVMTRFPFCIPFDLIDCVKAFETSAVEPRWEIPLNIPSIGFHYVFVLDLTQFGDLVKLLRVSVLLLYVGALILATRSLIKG